MTSDQNNSVNSPIKDQDNGKTDKLDLLLDLVKRSYDAELQRTRDLDAKAGSLIGYVTIVTGLLVGIGTFSLSDKLSIAYYLIPYLIGIGLLLSSLVMSLFAIRIQAFEIIPTFEQLQFFFQNDRIQYKYKEIAHQVIPSTIAVTNRNSQFNDNKAKWISRSWMCVVIGIGFIVIFTSIFLLTERPLSNEIKITIGGNTTEVKEPLINAIRTLTNTTQIH